MCRRALSLVAAVTLLGSIAPRSIATYVSPYVAQHDFSGVVYLTGRTGDIYRGVFGEDTSFQSVFAVGSISKTFTAAAVEVLAARGRLRYSDTLAGFVPEYRYARDVTIEQLLTHSAGVPDFYSLSAFAFLREKDLSLVQIAQWLSAFPLDFRPGAKSSYSNSGYSLLALVIERASHEPYDRFLNDNIFKPLGLTHTSADASGSEAGTARGYDPGPPPEYQQPAARIGEGWLIGNGSVRSNASDLARWLGIASEGRVVNFKSLAYPYGWSKSIVAGDRILGQDGRIPGFAAAISINERSGLKIIVLSNIQCAAASTIANAIRKAESGGPLVPPIPRQSYVARAEDLQKFVGTYGFPGLTLVVSAKDGALFLSNANDGMLLPLDPVGPSTFFFRPLYASVRFTTDAKGVVQSIDWGSQFTIPRIDAPRTHPPCL
jgi:D-alanyl-D-alanine carboxypeptidase